MDQKSLAPIPAAERIIEIDVVRGVALFGMLMVNMSFYKYSVYMERIPSAIYLVQLAWSSVWMSKV